MYSAAKLRAQPVADEVVAHPSRLLERRGRQDHRRHRGVEMAIADVGIDPIDHAGHAHSIHHHVLRMIVHVHQRIRAAAEFGRALGDEIKRLAQAGQRAVSRRDWRLSRARDRAAASRRSAAPIGRIGARNLAQAGAAPDRICGASIARARSEKNPSEKVLNALGKLRVGEQRPACEALHDQKRRAEGAVIGLEGVGSRDADSARRTVDRSSVFSRAPLASASGALVEAQHHRLRRPGSAAKRLRRRCEREFEDRGLPSAGKDAQARNAARRDKSARRCSISAGRASEGAGRESARIAA